ncbi:zinc-binding dehydrogenase [Nocardia transvalensis]|uniref:zinc-binding dehydrogenase n=1 Tax=Nocardia transvalensis TaxID=37333 RepID=UPI001893AFF9|nr:zinc-binding dehydrogenase [Nocardia transvalensis]MBF6330324.1 zinc-binding dehydrogenase [Nocardia transvalensis]
MRASIFHDGEFTVGDFSLPELRAWQIRVRPIANGICGGDLSAWAHTDEFLASNAEAKQETYLFDKNRPVVFGHEFTAEVTELGPEVTEYAVGQKLFVLPWVADAAGVVRCLGYANDYPGGMSTATIAGASMHVPLHDDVDPVLAATLEPVATGTNGARQTGIGAGEGALVTGAGPIGLGAVVELAARGANPIVVSDPSAKRREIALAYGAHVAVDPRTADPVAVWRELAEAGSRLYVVEASGARLLSELIATVPPHTVISVVGANARPESIRSMTAVVNNITLKFVCGPVHGETRYEGVWRAYEHLREGRYDPARMVTAYTGLAGAQAAFDALRPSDGATEQVKILIVPDLDTDELLTPEQAGFATVPA